MLCKINKLYTGLFPENRLFTDFACRSYTWRRATMGVFFAGERPCQIWLLTGCAAVACTLLITGCQSPAGLPPETAADWQDAQEVNKPITQTKVLALGKPIGLSIKAGLRSATLSWR